METKIPLEYLDLANCPRLAALTTRMPDGSPQTTVVWCNYDGENLLLNTMRGFRKEKNMRLNPQVTLLNYDPARTLRYLEVRGRVIEITGEGALEHLDLLSELYTGAKPYFGTCVPAELKERETPVKITVRPQHVVDVDFETPGKPYYRPPSIEPDPGLLHGPLPATHVDLLARPICGVFTTLMPDGQPQSSLVWCDYDGECARINLTLERQKAKNLQRDPRASLLVVDPDDTGRFIQIRGEVDLVAAGALEYLDRITRQYTPHPQFYGYVYPLERQYEETRLIARLHPRRVTVDAIHR